VQGTDPCFSPQSISLDSVDFGDGPYKRCAVSTSLARP